MAAPVAVLGLDGEERERRASAAARRGRHVAVADRGEAGRLRGLRARGDARADAPAAGSRVPAAAPTTGRRASAPASPRARRPRRRPASPRSATATCRPRRAATAPPLALFSVARDGGWGGHFVDLQRDVTVADLPRRSAPGCARSSTSSASPRPAPARPGQDHGRAHAAASLAELLGVGHGGLGTTTFRPPYTPVTFGRSPAATAASCSTRPHDRHARLARRRSGAVFEDVGQWKRPWYYPARRRGHGRGRAARVPRGARGRRRCMDASHAGQDRRAGAGRRRAPQPRLHQRLEPRSRSAAAATALMLRADGMVFDDGVTTRLGRGPLPHDHHHRQRGRACWPGSRSGCRPSGPS